MHPQVIAAVVSWMSGGIYDRFPAAFAQFAQAASPVALASMWQGAAIAIGLALCFRFVPRVSASHRFAAWTVGFAAVAALPFLPFVVHLVSSARATAQLTQAPASLPHTWLQFDIRWAMVIAALWLIASSLRAVQLAIHIVRLRTLWNSATPIADRDLAASLSASFRAARTVEICITQLLDRPSVIGFFAPRILIPDWLFARLTSAELRQVVLHEAEHLRRRDDWTNLIQKFCLILFPLNPALAWMEHRLCREREMACDEGVVRRTKAPRAYAACLAGLAERGLQRDMERRAASLSLAAWRGRPELVHRVHSILRRNPSLSPLAERAFIGIVGCGLLLGSVELARCPQMVAFVAAPTPQTFSAAETARLDRVTYTPANELSLANGASEYRFIQASAIMPSSIGETVPRRSLSALRRAKSALAASNSEIASNDRPTSAPHETLLKAEAASSDSAQSASQEDAGQYIVLASWQQVSAPPQNSRTIADYDTDAAANQRNLSWQNSGTQNSDQPNGRAPAEQSGNAGPAPAPIPAPQIIVTRLVLRIVPVAPAAGTKASQPDDSNSGQQPAAIPFGNGWLVFQL